MTDFPTQRVGGGGGGGAGGGYFPYILLNEIQTMFSQLTKRITSKTKDQRFLGRNKIMAVENGTISHHYILVIRKFIDFVSLFRHSVWFALSVKQDAV